jgi:hypothetical protein
MLIADFRRHELANESECFPVFVSTPGLPPSSATTARRHAVEIEIREVYASPLSRLGALPTCTLLSYQVTSSARGINLDCGASTEDPIERAVA